MNLATAASARRSPTQPFTPHVPVTPRPFLDAVAFSRLDSFSSFDPVTIDGVVYEIVRAADHDHDGAIGLDEARDVGVRDEYTSFHIHSGNPLEQTFIAATTRYDVSELVRAADVNMDSRIERSELGGYLAQFVPPAHGELIRSGDAANAALVDATSMVRVLEVVPRYEHTVRIPW